MVKKQKKKKKTNASASRTNKQQHCSRIGFDILHARNCKAQGPAINPSQAAFPLAFRIRFSEGLRCSVSLGTYKACLYHAGAGHDSVFK